MPHPRRFEGETQCGDPIPTVYAVSQPPCETAPFDYMDPQGSIVYSYAVPGAHSNVNTYMPREVQRPSRCLEQPSLYAMKEGGLSPQEFEMRHPSLGNVQCNAPDGGESPPQPAVLFSRTSSPYSRPKASTVESLVNQHFPPEKAPTHDSNVLPISQGETCASSLTWNTNTQTHSFQESLKKNKRIICIGGVILFLGAALGAIIGTVAGKNDEASQPATWGPHEKNYTESPLELLNETAAPSTLSPTPNPGTFGKCFMSSAELQNAIGDYLKNPSGKLTASYGHPINNWCVGKVDNFNNLFDAERNPLAEYFNEDISSWDVSSALSFDSMFWDAKSFNQDIGHWNVSQATSMVAMFLGASSFNGNLDSWDVSHVENFLGMFANASAFHSQLSDWDTSRALNMRAMFLNAASFNGDLQAWNTGNVRDMESMFSQAKLFHSDLRSWDVTSVASMELMFDRAENFNGDVALWDTSGVTTMRLMFSEAYRFNNDLSLWDVSNVIDMFGTFDRAKRFNRDISAWVTSNVETMESMFDGALAFNNNIGSWDTQKVKDMSFMFSQAKAFNQDISTWSVSNVQDMSCMFQASEAFNGDLAKWDVSNVWDMGNMFYGARAFNADITGWNVKNVQNMDNMFGRSAFNRDVSEWNVTKVNNFELMFDSATSFQQNLCPWGEHLLSAGSSTTIIVDGMFSASKCPNTADPDLAGRPRVHSAILARNREVSQ